jgi:hypothetical protein
LALALVPFIRRHTLRCAHRVCNQVSGSIDHV